MHEIPIMTMGGGGGGRGGRSVRAESEGVRMPQIIQPNWLENTQPISLQLVLLCT